MEVLRSALGKEKVRKKNRSPQGRSLEEPRSKESGGTQLAGEMSKSDVRGRNLIRITVFSGGVKMLKKGKGIHGSQAAKNSGHRHMMGV